MIFQAMGCCAVVMPSSARVLRNTGFVLKLVGYVLLAAGISILMLNLVDSMDALNRAINAALSTGRLDFLQYVLYSILYTPIILLAASAVLGYIGGSLEKRAEEMRKEFLEKLVGMVLMYQGITVQDLARRLGETPRTVEEALAEITKEGRLRIRVDNNGVVHVEQPAPQQAQATAPPLAVTPAPAPPVPPPPAQPVAPESDNVRGGEAAEEGTQVMPQGVVGAAGGEAAGAGSVEEQLKRIEEAYRRGLISEETYRQLVEKLKKGGTA